MKQIIASVFTSMKQIIAFYKMKQIIASVLLDILLSYAIGNNIFCIFKKFVFKFNKNRTTLTCSYQRNGQRDNEIIVIYPCI